MASNGGQSRDLRDPDLVTAPLHPKAEQILAAAQRVLLRDGYEGLSIRRVGEEAGESSSLVMYHFGDKATLIALLVDSLWHYADVRFVESVDTFPADARTRVDALVRLHSRFAQDAHLYQMYFELLPHITRNRQARALLAQIYDSYRNDIGVRCLRPTPLAAHRQRPLASLLLAVGEGLPVQNLLAPHDVDEDASFDFLATIVRGFVEPGTENGTSRSDREATDDPGRPVEPVAQSHPERQLPASARDILSAALRLVKRSGFEALTLDAVGHASGQPRSSVSYYFGDKRGLVVAVADAAISDSATAYLKAVRNLRRGGSLDAALHPLLQPRSPLRIIFDLLPAARRDDIVKEKLAVHYRWLRASVAREICGHGVAPQPACNAWATLAVATIDGLMIQRLVDPASSEPDGALSTFDDLRHCALAHLTAR